MTSKRSASHAGTWYSSDGNELERQITKWMQDASVPSSIIPKVLLVPHAGYAYSGSIAAYSYKMLTQLELLANRKSIVLLGPMHRFSGGTHDAYVSPFSSIDTPLGALSVDVALLADLVQFNSTALTYITPDKDIEEHSLEMQYPFLSFCLRGHPHIKVAPIYVKSISDALVSALEFFLKQNESIIIISSDFCHWGPRYHYTYLHDLNSSAVSPLLGSSSFKLGQSLPNPASNLTNLCVNRSKTWKETGSVQIPNLQRFNSWNESYRPVLPSLQSMLSLDKTEHPAFSPNASNVALPIHERIRNLDTEALQIFSQVMGPASSSVYDKFEWYLYKTKNTICGRASISLLLKLMSKLSQDYEFTFSCLAYAQSNQVVSPNESSVSYVAAVFERLKRAY